MRPEGVLVVERHGLHALELRRAGLTVVELLAADEGPADRAGACVVDAVSGTAPDPRTWARVVEALRADPLMVLLAVVAGELPSWLGEFADRAVRVPAPISGPALADRVVAEVGVRDVVVDLGLTSERIIDLVVDLDREAEGALAPAAPAAATTATATTTATAATAAGAPGDTDRPRALPRALPRGSVSVPLGLANLPELATRLLTALAVTPPLREVAEQVAEALGARLHADVAVLVRDVDAPSWTVVAGVGLRALEWRGLAADPPLLDLLGARRPILLVRSSDDVRQAAAGLPCAGREHLLVGRCSGLDVVVTAGRDEPPMTQDDVRVLGRLLDDDAALVDALALRELAVRMRPYAAV